MQRKNSQLAFFSGFIFISIVLLQNIIIFVVSPSPKGQS